MKWKPLKEQQKGPKPPGDTGKLRSSLRSRPPFLYLEIWVMVKQLVVGWVEVKKKKTRKKA